MSDDWARLTRVREAQLAAAREALQREREAFEAGRAQAQAARNALAAERQGKQRLWQQAVQGGAQGCAVGALRQTHAWSGALDRRIAQAAQGVQSADAALHALQARLDAQQAQLRHASAQVEKVRQVAERLQHEARRAQDAREEGRLDDSAAERWLRTRGPRAA
jgi:hypothetical protein